jgi:hypothetical protein
LKICCIEFPVVFFFPVFQNFLPSCQFHSNHLWSVATEGCVNICLISSCSPRSPGKTKLLLPIGVEVGLIVCVFDSYGHCQEHTSISTSVISGTEDGPSSRASQ